MKLKVTAIFVALFCFSMHSFVHAQRELVGKKPDLSLLSVKVKKEGIDQLNVIWSIKNIGEATAVGLDNLVSFNLESSDKPNRAGETHNWVSRGSLISLNTTKKELKPGETATGSCLVSCTAQDLVSLRVSLYVEQDNLVDHNKENNSLITLLVGK